MAKFLLAYRGGDPGDGEVNDEVMNEWMAWFGSLGSAVTDIGNPFAGGTEVASDGSRSAIAAGLTGYSVIEADDLDAATAAAANCPQLKAGGSVEVYEAIPM